MYSSLIALFVLLSIGISKSEPEHSVTLKDNAIGLVYVNSLVPKPGPERKIEFRIDLPIEAISDLTAIPDNYRDHYFEKEETIEIHWNGNLSLFGAYGEIVSIEGPQVFQLEHWCSNDGGDSFRPTLILDISQEKFKYPVGAEPDLQYLMCFAVLNPDPSKVGAAKDPGVGMDIRLQGKLDPNGKTAASAYVYKDDAENCSGEPANNLVVNLATAAGNYTMRCCGP